ncbi:MAG: NADPH-dependent 7-cyano-7-deazaguanine reductase QueF [Candidatus Marinimicrobia bacterium]|nr:NADPH-dependent 7-cyano-7-deazaguanine reductase QueF [Candidatus Neomarinimicrobiota bacterium]|tara:strand:+ start:8647 stop:9039 length:393 start_codon:yes stop_codon:yes gene_type:complete
MPFFILKGNKLEIKNLPSYKELEIVDNNHPNRDYKINISIPEFNCVCPKTGLPDFANIQITYIPNKSIVELKSLKLYMVKFRNIGIYHEYVTNQILDDFKKACNPKSIEVIGDFHPRGGVKTIVTVNHPD